MAGGPSTGSQAGAGGDEGPGPGLVPGGGKAPSPSQRWPVLGFGL